MRSVVLYGIAAIVIAVVAAIGLWAYVMSNVEQPSYRTIVADGAIELRDYPPSIVPK